MLEQFRQLCRRAAGHQGLRRYGANTLWMLLEKGFRLVLGFLIGVYVARQLGPAQYGLLNYAISFIALFSILATLGMDAVVVRELVRRPEKSDSILGSALALKAVGFAAMAAAVGTLLMVSSMNPLDKLLMAVILAGYGFQVFQVFDFSFQSRVLSKYSAMSQIAALVVASGFRLWFAWKGAPLWCFAAAESGYVALSVFGYAFFYRKSGGRILHWRFDSHEAFFLLRESLPLLLAGAAGMIYLRIDQVMVTWMLGDAANGQYAVAVRLVEVLYLLPLVVADSFFPSLVGTRSTSLLRYYRRTEQLMRFLFYCAALLVIPVACGGYILINFFYGTAFSEAAQLFFIFAFKILLVYPCLVLAKWYLVEKLQNIVLFYSIAGAVSSIIFNLLFISFLGLPGVVVSSIMTTFCVNLVFPLFFKHGRFGVRLFLCALLPTFQGSRFHYKKLLR